MANDDIKQKTKRDYDNEPIVIENRLGDYNVLATSLVSGIVVLFIVLNSDEFSFENLSTISLIVFVQSIYNIANIISKEKNTKIYLTNSCITKVKGNNIINQVYTSNIANILKTVDNTEEIDDSVDIKTKRVFILFSIFIVFPIILSFLVRYAPIVVIIVLCLIAIIVLLPRIFFLRKTKLIDPLYNILFIEDKVGRCLSFTINNDEEYLELHKYFLDKAYKNINKSEKRVSSFLYLVFKD